MSRLLVWLDARSRAAVNGVALALLGAISAVDYVTPPQISTFVFYMAPISVAAWFAGRGSGQVIAVLAAGAWTAKDIVLRGAPYAEPGILFWNTVARLITFSIVAWLISEVRLHLRREEQLARTDSLTGLLRADAFRQELAAELARAGRANSPVSFVYIDLDDFKAVNDRRGHAEGDRVLSTVGKLLRAELRQSDVIGRLGGDEFAMILPATDADQARTVVSNMQARVRTELQRHDWPVTLSIGVITCLTPRASPDALVQAADSLMYEVKAAGKDAALHRTWPRAT